MSTDTEALIVILLGAILKDPSVVLERNTSFVELGLDSLGGIRLIGQLETHLGREVDPTSILDCPTIAALAAHLEGAGA
jgi:acyl carrier protein